MPRWRPLARASFCRLRKAGNVDGGSGHFQRLFVGGVVVFEAHRGLVGKGVDQVAAADLDRVDAERGRRLVHQTFKREGDDRPRYAAIRRHGAGVGQHAARARFVVLDVIGAGHLGHRHQRLDPARGRETGIGADISDDVGFQRDQFGVLVEGALQRNVLVARMEAGDQVFAPVLAPGERAFIFARQPDQHDVFRGQRHFLSEAAADIGRDHAQVALRHAEHVGNGGAGEMRHLRRAGQRDAAGGRIVGGVAAARLHRRRVLAVRARVDRDDLVRAAPGGIETFALELAFEDDIARRFGMDLRRAGCERRARVNRGLDLGDIERDLIDNVLGFFLARRDHGGDRLADETHHAVGQNRLRHRLVVELVQHRLDRLHVGEIGRGDDPRVLRRVDLADFAGGDGAAHEAHPVHRLHVSREAAAAGDQRGILQPPDGTADPGHAGALAMSGHFAASCKARRTTARTKSRR